MNKKLLSNLGLVLFMTAPISVLAQQDQVANFNSANSEFTIPAIRINQDPNQEFTDVKMTFLQAQDLNFLSPNAQGIPLVQEIRVNLSPAQEVASGVASAGGCRGVVRIESTTRIIDAAVVCDSVDVVAAHIHNAPVASNGGILLHMEVDTSISPQGTINGSLMQLSQHDCTARTNPGSAQAEGSCLNNGIVGRTQLSAAEYADFLEGNFYFNVHTPANPTGELRGQISPRRTVTSSVQCSQSEVEVAVGSVTSETNASGSDFATCAGSLALDLASKDLRVRLTPDLAATVTAAHIHEQPDGSATGPIIVSLSSGEGGTFTAASDAKLTDSQISSLMKGNLYFNIHTSSNPAGSTRAQIQPTLE